MAANYWRHTPYFVLFCFVLVFFLAGISLVVGMPSKDLSPTHRDN